MKNTDVLNVLSSSLFPHKEIPFVEDWMSIYNELSNHAVATIAAGIINQVTIPEEIRTIWKKRCLYQISYNIRYKTLQSELPVSVPYVILKGTSAAQYYPYPELRTMGDIDIMTRREDYDKACNDLITYGFDEIHNNEESNERHRSFVKNGIVIEVHRSFAMLNDPDKAKYLDDLIVENINDSHVLPDMINGLTILEHISQHLEEGIGLRQIIDWMLFEYKCVSDEQWCVFFPLAHRIGLDMLAIVLTRMCEIYFKLPSKLWCKDADERLCEQLMDYILSSGNFGRKRISDADISENALAYASTPKLAYKLLKNQGMVNWKAARKYKILKPFAWLYQLNRYISRGLKREHAITRLREEFAAAQRRNTMLHELGVRTAKED